MSSVHNPGLDFEHGCCVLYRGTNNVLVRQEGVHGAGYSYLRLVDGVLVAVQQNEVAGAAPDEGGRRGGPHPAHQPPGAAHLGPGRSKSAHVLSYCYRLCKCKYRA